MACRRSCYTWTRFTKGIQGWPFECGKGWRENTRRWWRSGCGVGVGVATGRGRRRLHAELQLAFVLPVVVRMLSTTSFVRRRGRRRVGGRGVGSGIVVVATLCMVSDGVMPHVVDGGRDTLRISLGTAVAPSARVTSLAQTAELLAPAAVAR